MKKHIFDGIATALITPFCESGIDYTLFEKQIERQLENGIDAIVVARTTGEAPTLTDEEHISLIECAVSFCSGEIPVIAGCGSNCTEHAVFTAKEAENAGADALLAVTPYYNKASSQGLILSYRAIAEASSLPLILYNVPSRTGMEISYEAYNELQFTENIVGSKEAPPLISRFGHLIENYGENLDFYCGNDEMTLACLAMGGKGTISVLSNILPKETKKIYSLWKEYRNEEATALMLKLIPLIEEVFSDVNPIPIKTAMAYKGLDSGILRLPLCEMSIEKKNRLLTLLDDYNVPLFSTTAR